MQHFSAKTLLTSTVVEFGLELCQNTVVPGFWVLGFSALPGFRALKAGDRAWLLHKMLFGFRAPLFQLFTWKISNIYCKNLTFCSSLLQKEDFCGVSMVLTAKLLTKLTFD